MRMENQKLQNQKPEMKDRGKCSHFPFSTFHSQKWKDLFLLLVSRDIKLKYRRSVLGYLWSILSPLLLMSVMWALFSGIFSQNVRNFPVYLICGNLLFSFLREGTSHALGSVTDNAALLKKTRVPRAIFTVSRVSSDFVNLFFSFGALFLVMLFTGLRPSWYMLCAILPVVELYFFTLGLGLFLAAVAVFFRDIRHIWNVVLTAWMYLTPLFYTVDVLPEAVRFVISRLNPMYFYVTMFRHYVLYRTAAGLPLLLAGALAALMAMALGIFTFQRTQQRFILYI